MRHLITLALLALPAALGAQGTAHTVAPGMSRAQVVAALGEPANARTTNGHTYLFYRNQCGRECGMNDLVVLQRDSVVDAIFRSADRHYTGRSSSPAAVSRTAARVKTPRRKPPVSPTPASEMKGPVVAAPRMAPPSDANDRRPSIPAGEPRVQPAPASPKPTPTPIKPRTP